MSDITQSLQKLVGSFNAVSDAAKAESEKIILENQRKAAMDLPSTEMIPPPLAKEQS